jgi:putative ABC transport system permease protein
MSKFLLLIAKNLGRNRLRTALSAIAVIVLVSIYTAASAITNTVDQLVRNQGSQNKLIVSERWVSPSELPVRYVPELTQLPGVTDWTVWHYYGGCFDESMQEERMGLGIATRIDNLKAMHDDLESVDPAAIAALDRERTGALVGGFILDTMHWKIGQGFTFISRSHPDHNLRFKIVGAVRSGTWSRSFFFREDYFQEATGDKATVNLIWLRVRDAAAAERVSAEISSRFEKRQPEVSVSTEAASVARIAGRNEAILSTIQLVVAILLVDMIFVLSNSISIATRERRVEMAVLMMLGFRPVHIMALVVGEAMLVGAVSGLLGTSLAWGCSELAINGFLPPNDVTEFFMTYPIVPSAIWWGVLLGMGVGFGGSALPAWNARLANMSQVFANIA